MFGKRHSGASGLAVFFLDEQCWSDFSLLNFRLNSGTFVFCTPFFVYRIVYVLKKERRHSCISEVVKKTFLLETETTFSSSK